ncbi:membrane-bound lytic murein transglycosylase E [uncultured bacterium]|nr:membrane-bound lytic murein transglycosylase E [uncultured bacterium]
MKKTITIAFLITAFFAGASGARADFFQYTDDAGVVHITNVPTSKKYKWMMEERRLSVLSPMNPAYKKISKQKFDEMISNAAARYGIDPHLVRAIVKAESDYDEKAVSKKGATGLMQLMPATATRMGVKNIHDPEDNVEGGIKYLSKLLKMFDWQVPLAVAAYNAGENAVVKYGNRIPPYNETQTYVKRVLHYYKDYKGSD